MTPPIDKCNLYISAMSVLYLRSLTILFAASVTLWAQPAAEGLYLHREYRTEHNGVTHRAYRQRIAGLDVYGKEYVVNLDRDGKVISEGGSLAPPPAAGVFPTDSRNVTRAVEQAVAMLHPSAAAGVRSRGINAKGQFRFATAADPAIDAMPVWFDTGKALTPAWQVTLTAEDGVSVYQAILDASGEHLLHKELLTHFQSVPRGLVYTGYSPQPVPPGVQVSAPPPIVGRQLAPFTGPVAASPFGWFSGVETAGNNAIVGANPQGIGFLTTPALTRSATLDFQFPIQLGLGAPSPLNYADAAATNLFYWINRAHDLFHENGFSEAAGNFQAHNFGRGGLGGDAIFAYTHYGASNTSGFAALNNAFYSTRGRNDGEPAMIAMYIGSGNGIFTDGSLDNHVILHEYAHGVTGRLVPTLSGHQGGAMNEAFSDFWATEFLLSEGAPPDGVYPVGEYLFQTFGVGIRSRPYTTNMEINPLTYADLGRVVSAPAIHDDGGIWFMALWEARANLIRQFGEREGRRRLRLMVIDGLKLVTPTPSMVDMRDAILLADRVNFGGASQSQLWAAFAKRGLGVLAYSPTADTVLVRASSATPSNRGAIGFTTGLAVAGETLTVLLHDGNLTGNSARVDVTASSGDVAKVQLTRRGSLFVGTLLTSSTAPARPDDPGLSIIRGDSISLYYVDADTGQGPQLIETTIPSTPNYTVLYRPNEPLQFPNETNLNFRFSARQTFSRNLLPFPFPFYDRVYREVRILPEGLVQFDSALTPTCITETGLPQLPAIAPMWTWMRTNGSTQPNQSVFVSSTPNSYTIRWAGETIPLLVTPPLTPAPEPLNFAVTLFADGRIRFHYGSGNQNIVNSSPFFGCTATQPVIGISRGTGTPAILPSVHYERVNLRDAFQAEFHPPFGHASEPVVRIESPGADPDSKLTVRGIAYDVDAPITALNLLVDGVFQGRLAVNQPRADICGRENLPGCPLIGFQQSFDRSALNIGPGAHRLQIRAVNSRGGFRDYPEQPLEFTISGDAPEAPRAVLESPAEGTAWKGVVLVRGYAYGISSRVAAVNILIDGIGFGRAVYGQSDPAACAGPAAGSPNCPNVAFLAQVNTTATAPALADGPHTLQFQLIDETGRITVTPAEGIRINVDNGANQPPRGVITFPVNGQKVSGMITVTGHAWDPDGRVTSAVLAIDGLQRVVATLGRPAPEACAELNNPAGCPNIGFTVTYDTRRLSNGNHVLGMRLVDDKGAVVIIPAITESGMNIVVEN